MPGLGPDKDDAVVTCPACGRLSPPVALSCECGWDFASGEMRASSASSTMPGPAGSWDFARGEMRAPTLPGPPGPQEAVQEVLLYALLYTGAGGTLLLVLVGIGRVGSYIILPGYWMLSPYLGASILVGQRPRTRGEGLILILALVLLIALGANAYLASYTFVGGRLHPSAEAVTLIVIPMVQWVVLGLAALLRAIWSRL